MPSDIAFLAYYPDKQRQDNNSFEGNYNIGANVVMDVLKHNGVECDICTPDTGKLFHLLCFHPKFKKGTAKEKVNILKHNFDLSPYLREYGADEKHPAWFLSSYIDTAKLRKVYEISKSRVTSGPPELIEQIA